MPFSRFSKWEFDFLSWLSHFPMSHGQHRHEIHYSTHPLTNSNSFCEAYRDCHSYILIPMIYAFLLTTQEIMPLRNFSEREMTRSRIWGEKPGQLKSLRLRGTKWCSSRTSGHSRILSLRVCFRAEVLSQRKLFNPEVLCAHDIVVCCTVELRVRCKFFYTEIFHSNLHCVMEHPAI